MTGHTRFLIGAGFGSMLLALSLVSSGFGADHPTATQAVFPKTGSYKGKTRQGRKISFRVKNGKVGSLKFKWAANCTGGTATGSTSISKKLRIVNGRFRYSSGGTRVSGSFTSSTKVKGKLKVKSSTFDPFVGTNTCSTGAVRWKAKHR